MGVDVGYTIKLINSKNQDIKSIVIGCQVNSFDSLFNAQVISTTSIPFDIRNVLDENEVNVFSFHEISERKMQTTIFEATKGLNILNRIHRKLLFHHSSNCLLEDLTNIDILDYDNKKRAMELKLNKIRNYFDLFTALSMVIGILETAAAFDCLVQIEVEYY